ncbi:Gp15 family bacteriophage protein [Clostridium sp. HBUAS56010]|uniref:Gp15 family bacteriophage protein n=1 Tax=Clostridium sp. HBUAS56010 TaxID=2571127 RepID=UPI0011780168|nr:Gp15 family bacteriophage protein [Clostridium sp. HBUAS56010]
MIDPFSLPTALEVGGKLYKIRTDYRVVLDILTAYGDPELDAADKTQVLIEVLYINYETIPPEHMEEAVKKASWFLDANLPHDLKPHPVTMDWLKDAPIIIPEVNKNIGTEVRSVKYMHWWTFFGAYMQIGGDGLYSSVINVRQKRAKGEKLEKWESKFYKENQALCDLNWEQKKKEMEAVEKIFG